MLFALEQSRQHRAEFLANSLRPELKVAFDGLAEKSLADQRALETQDTLSFEEFRQRYVSPDSLRV